MGNIKHIDVPMRIAARVTEKQRGAIEELVNLGKYESLSHFMRAAIGSELKLWDEELYP